MTRILWQMIKDELLIPFIALKTEYYDCLLYTSDVYKRQILKELGQPMHAFDYSYLEGDEIVVRRANDGEKIVTLDEKEFEMCIRDRYNTS